MAKPRGWTVEVSRKQLQNSALYSVDRSKVMEVDLDAVETQVQKTLCESDTTISDFDSTEVYKIGNDSSVTSFGDNIKQKSDLDSDKIMQYPNAYPYDANPVVSGLEHDKKRLKAWMSSTTMAISQKVKSLVNVQRKLLEKSSSVEKTVESTPNLLVSDMSTELSSEPKSIDLQTLVKPTIKPTKCYLEFTEMSTTPTGALSSLDPFVIGKAIDVMKAMSDSDWDKVKHLYEMFKRAGRLDQLIIYEFAIKIIVNTRGKSGVVDVLRDIDGDLAEAAFRFGKTLLSLYHGSFLLSEGVETRKPPKKEEVAVVEPIPAEKEEQAKKVPNRGAQIPENVRQSYENPKKEQGPRRSSYAYLFKDAAAAQKNQKKNNQCTNVTKKNTTTTFKRTNTRRNSPSGKPPVIRNVNPKYAHVKSRYREAAAKLGSQPTTAVKKVSRKQPLNVTGPTTKRITSKTAKITNVKECRTFKPQVNSVDDTPPTPRVSPTSSVLSTPDSNMDSTTRSFNNNQTVNSDATERQFLAKDLSDTNVLADKFKDLVKKVVSEERLLNRTHEALGGLIEPATPNPESTDYEDPESSYIIDGPIYKGPTGDYTHAKIEFDSKPKEPVVSSPHDDGDNPTIPVVKSRSEPNLLDKNKSEEKYCLVTDNDGSESNFSVTTLYKQLPNLRPFIIDRLLMNVLLAYLLAVTGGALCADDSKSLYCTLSLTLKGKLRTMLIRALRLVDDF
ncbi:uncharacterized protein LOC106669123 [Cimex lectularius]|uniref:Uncharacterized protein n=1 Tax=Cimex lectularius TaxID=79782 RepID=A0A8I6RX10_CIMLE|nr:uncharacterized protein LOC106669123 [Cimex lectularius]